MDSDITVNGGARVKRINTIANELIEEGHSQSNNIRRRLKEINDIWNGLQNRQKSKSDELETAERVAEFNAMCEQTRAWIDGKFDLLGQEVEAKDLKALQVGRFCAVTVGFIEAMT